MKLFKATIPEMLRRRVKESGKKTAYIFDGESYTWMQTDQLSDQLALRMYRDGVRKGTHVGILGVNTMKWVLAYYAALKLGAVCVLINYNYKQDELQDILQYSDVEYLVIGEARGDLCYEDMLAPVRTELPKLKQILLLKDVIITGDTSDTGSDRTNENNEIQTSILYEALAQNAPSEDDVALIIFTSGTTLRPKGVQLEHGQLIQTIGAVAKRGNWTERDRIAMPLPMFHGSGANCGILLALLSGMSMVILRTYRSVDTMKAIEQYECTVFNAVPSMLLAMIRNPAFGKYDLHSLRSGTISGATISEDNYRMICEKLQVDDFLPAYGMTETSTLNTLAEPSSAWVDRIDTAGTLLPDMEMRIWDDAGQKELEPGKIGEIQIRGACITRGYYHMQEKTRESMMEGGWFRTGDAGFVDSKGQLHFRSRLSEMIVRGGENISPPEIEQCIEAFDETILGSKVVGVPDPVLQEEIAAFIRYKDQKIDEAQLQKYLSEHLACYKVPKYIWQMKEFPMTGSGKTDGKAMKQLAAELINRKTMVSCTSGHRTGGKNEQ